MEEIIYGNKSILITFWNDIEVELKYTWEYSVIESDDGISIRILIPTFYSKIEEAMINRIPIKCFCINDASKIVETSEQRENTRKYYNLIVSKFEYNVSNSEAPNPYIIEFKTI